jgi:hypothetical protein
MHLFTGALLVMHRTAPAFHFCSSTCQIEMIQGSQQNTVVNSNRRHTAGLWNGSQACLLCCYSRMDRLCLLVLSPSVRMKFQTSKHDCSKQPVKETPCTSGTAIATTLAFTLQMLACRMCCDGITYRKLPPFWSSSAILLASLQKKSPSSTWIKITFLWLQRTRFASK